MGYYSILDTKIGKLEIEEQDEKIVRIGMTYNFSKDAPYLATPLLREAGRQILEYLEGKRKEFTFPIELKGTDYQKKVWSVLLQIPYGETRTYRQVAAIVGNEKAARAVGGACNKNPVMIAVPCHRVVGSDKSLTGYAGGLKTKEFLLTLERQA